MKIAVCIDEKNGMCFGGRRQSRDSLLLADLSRHTGAGRLLASPFSDKMLSDAKIPHFCSDGFLDIATENDVCFVENLPVSDCIKDCTEFIVYKWNRHYPSDMKLDILPENAGFSLKESYDFEGSSHEKITKEIYVK